MENKRVIVIGGGLSGLTAAYRLQTDLQGVDVTVLEANAYPGGRMLTTDFGGEAGGESIGFYYGGLQHLAEEIGVEIGAAPITILNQSFNLAYYFEAFQEWIEQKNWAAWAHNPLPPQWRHTPPIMLLRDFVNRVPQPDFDTLLDNPQMRRLAGQSLLEFLRAQDAPASVFPFIESNFEVNDDLASLSAFTSVLKSWITQPMADSKYYFIKGGNQQLPRALAARLKQVHLHQQVVAVRQIDDRQHEVRTSDGSTYVGDYVIFALPAGPLRRIDIDPPFEGLQQEALEQIRYTPSVKVFYKVKKNFWEEDHLPIFMWTDTVVNFVIPVYDKDTCENPLVGSQLWGLYTVSNGVRAKQLYEIQRQGGDIAEHCRAVLERIRPAMHGALEAVEVVDWGNKETALGAFHYYEPNERILDYYKHIATPSHGRYFACEHTEYRHKGFEAAVQAGLRAAREVCKDIVNKRVLIIGCGNLGSVLARTWRERYYDTRVTTTTPAKQSALAAIADEVRVLKIDDQVENVQALEAALADRDVVVCLVGPTPGKAKTPREIQEHYTDNLLRPAQIITDLLQKRPGSAPHVVFASSLSVYGTGEQSYSDRITEATPASPTNPSARLYDATEQVYLSSGLPVTVLRLGALYDRGSNAFVHQARMAVEKMGGMSPFDPEGLLCKIGLWDAARAIDCVVSGRHYGVFNVCEPGQVTIKQYFDHLCAQHGLPPIRHLGMIKGARQQISCDKIAGLGFRLTPPQMLVLGSGELATHVARAALHRGYDVTLTTTTPAKVDVLQEQYEHRVQVLVVEGGDAEAVAGAMQGKDVVVIAVAPKKERLRGLTFDDHFYRVFSEAYKGTAHNVVRAWQKMDQRPQVVYVSAHSVYPDTDGGVVDENTYPLPRHRVASILREAELTILDWIPDSTVLRLGWLLSPRRNWKNILTAFARLELPGTGNITANMVHVEDAAHSVLFSIAHRLQGVYNVCNDAHPTWGELWGVAAHHLGMQPPQWHPHLKDEWFEGHHTVSNQKIKAAGFTFKYPHETGLSFMVDASTGAASEHLQSAMLTAWVRAVETQKQDGLFADPYAELFSGRPNIALLNVRTRLLDAEIVKAVSGFNAGCQVVILGAGMDTRALRLEALAQVPVFEIDLPLVMSTKNRLISQHHLHREAYRRVEADLERDDWPVLLQAAGYRDTVPTVWVAEGLLTYLHESQAGDLITRLSHLSAFNSILIADIPTSAAQGKNPRIRFTCDAPQAWLERCGWCAVEPLEPEGQDRALQERLQSAHAPVGVFRAQKQKRVLIIGCGYFGTQLLQHLKASGAYRLLATTTTPGRTAALAQAGAWDTLVWDGTDPEAIARFVASADAIVVGLRSPRHDHEAVLASLRQIAPALRSSQQLIYISSIEVYSGGLAEVREEDACPDTIQTGMEAVFAGHPCTCTLRISQLYGPGADHRQEARTMRGHIDKILALTRGILPGDGGQPVHLTHVQDLVAFVALALARGLRGTFNLCKTLECTQKTFLDRLCAYYQLNPIQWSPSMPMFKHMMVPSVIHTDRLHSLPYALDENRYAMESLLRE